MSVSYSLHVGSGKNSLSSCAKVKSADKHNLRKYDSYNFDKSKIFTIYGSDNIFKDVQNLYKVEFNEVLKSYNERQKRKDRRIDDYLQYVSESNKDVAVEIIVQIGDIDFWKSIPYHNDYDYSDTSFDDSWLLDTYSNISKTDTINLYKQQLQKIQELLPNFKIANATIHLDESSPHMHIVGVPIAEGFEKGLSKQVSKRSVFTKDSLVRLQEEMHSFAEEQMKSFDVDVKEKSKGHIHYSQELYVLIKQIKEKREELADLDHKLAEADLKHLNLKNDINNLETLKNVLNRQIERLRVDEKSLKDMAIYYTKKIRDIITKLEKPINDIDINNTLIDSAKILDELKEQVSVVSVDEELNKELVGKLDEVKKETKTKINSRSGKAR